ncbi:serine/threonine protein kinase [Pirellula staleyi DSM 6068]|uniref:non-specific serine/threonine protein kinase n=1 Tax=Pirellula staleyi (strain ATCC 27377 / DSM 6068 / ICPB 4128) TaxID=530564 RepID=D2R1G6_PIRSD|nr:serine/threonine-protein kinase [Pirellula staleyi]ADB14951.1 serine/threonine protein kinase [Pirellula staleyi DSM 6068]
MSHPNPTQPTTEADLSGRKLGDYQLLRRLGRGGMAEVYLAQQLSLRRQVAFKVLRRTLAVDSTYVRRFHHEAQAAAGLVHANIVQIHEVGCIDGVHYIAQEYVAGQNLKQYLARHGSGLTAPIVVSILRQVAAALQRAAEQNITHRDIKPENIMLSGSGEVKVADFGLARVARDGAQMDLTQVGITMGTPLYMSPEQVEGKGVDPRSDLYSLGVTCYHMLAGRPPFDGETALAIAVQHLKNEPKRLEAIRPDLPEGLCRVVHKMLEKRPDARYQKPAELIRDLRMLRIEGTDDDWQSSLPADAAAEIQAMSSSRMAATQQLQQVVASSGESSFKLPLVVLLLAVILAFPIGGAAAFIFREDPLLAFDRKELPQIKRMQTVEQQWYFATIATSNVEQAWKAVARYFPPQENPTNLRYSRLAAKGLAMWHLSQGRAKEALPLFHELSLVEETAGQFHLSGLAGKAICYDRLNKPDEAQQILAEIMPRVREILDGTLRADIDRLTEKYRQQSQGAQ